MPGYRRLALRLLALGGLIALVGVIGLVAGIGEKTSRTAAGEPASDVKPAPVGQTPLEFVAALAKAERDADLDFRLARLHPAVIERYGEDQCRAALDDPADPTARFEAPKVDHVGSWDYTSDGQTTTIEKTTFVDAERYDRSHSGGQDIVVHIAKAGGEYRWFTDCTS